MLFDTHSSCNFAICEGRLVIMAGVAQSREQEIEYRAVFLYYRAATITCAWILPVTAPSPW